MPAATPVLAFVTCPDRDSGLSIAHALVEQRLAASVNLLPGVTSVYRWQGNIHEEPECQLLMQTTAEQFGALQQAVVMLHPYELPEIVSVRIDAGLPDYLQWIIDNT